MPMKKRAADRRNKQIHFVVNREELRIVKETQKRTGKSQRKLLLLGCCAAKPINCNSEVA